MVSWSVARIFLAVWLAGFAVQATDLLTVIAPDDCTEETRGSASDPCSDGCPRCMCCARVPVFIPQAALLTGSPLLEEAVLLPPADRWTTPSPAAIFHVPKLG